VKFWPDATHDHLVWLSYDADPPAVVVVFDAREAVELHEAGKTVVAYTPNGTSVNPLQAAPWKSEDDHLAGR
jgi:hypothetical protein